MIDWIFTKLKTRSYFLISWHVRESSSQWCHLHSIQTVYGSLPDLYSANKQVALDKEIGFREAICLNVQKIDKNTYLVYEKMFQESFK